ncbi:ATP-dependent metallopeptidase FtsH/Yme1/Tma family protein [Candidatus Epulonipiscium viviparus]|uniref:ATP-dependent metallopeptidase FtsH/Yme1/Tma family protein n=1 Tax=Candidatus Epulonipiscium viviparus TaxID=420336 RepID=UPI00273812FD|nr:ATP-dependent metallopeptidase FtsH/Yme1/Tma family protein [Candidatus Epulopiscium viviparus]
MSRMKKNHKKALCFGFIIILTIATIVALSQTQVDNLVSYQTFINAIENENVTDVQLSDSEYIKFNIKTEDLTYKTENPRTTDFKEMLLLNGISVKESAPATIVQYLFSSAIILGASITIFRHAKAGGGKQSGFRTTKVETANLKMDFSNIAGNVEAKEQVQDIVDFIKAPHKYADMGATMPKGLIFYGPPGTGKTMMAKALAKEANVPFFSVSGSDFMQMYVGVGASRIRELFREAKKSEKAVIFIDEIDAIGKTRSNTPGGSGSDEKDQTLNALLTEMSGFNSASGIVVIAATNRLDILDEALLRPGRFDRHIQIGYPDQEARKHILSLYLQNKPIDASVNVEKISEETLYFTGAMLENFVNEAAIMAVKENVAAITATHFDKAFYTVIAGSEKKDRSMISFKDKQITAYHEAGHALVTKIVAPENKVSRVTIIPSTKGAGGFSMNIAKEKMYQTKQEIIANIKIALAGRVAEEIIFGRDFVTTGASNDIEKATKYIKDYITKYGMDETFGMVNTDLFGDSVKDEVLLLTKNLMKEIYSETVALMIDNRGDLEKLANALIKKETLNHDDIEALLAS